MTDGKRGEGEGVLFRFGCSIECVEGEEISVVVWEGWISGLGEWGTVFGIGTRSMRSGREVGVGEGGWRLGCVWVL